MNWKQNLAVAVLIVAVALLIGMASPELGAAIVTVYLATMIIRAIVNFVKAASDSD